MYEFPSSDGSLQSQKRHSVNKIEEKQRRDVYFFFRGRCHAAQYSFYRDNNLF